MYMCMCVGVGLISTYAAQRLVVFLNDSYIRWVDEREGESHSMNVMSAIKSVHPSTHMDTSTNAHTHGRADRQTDRQIQTDPDRPRQTRPA